MVTVRYLWASKPPQAFVCSCPFGAVLWPLAHGQETLMVIGLIKLSMGTCRMSSCRGIPLRREAGRLHRSQIAGVSAAFGAGAVLQLSGKRSVRVSDGDSVLLAKWCQPREGLLGPIRLLGVRAVFMHLRGREFLMPAPTELPFGTVSSHFPVYLHYFLKGFLFISHSLSVNS